MQKTDKEIYKEFGERIKKLRIQKGLTQTELANDLGMTQSTVYKYEKGLRKVPMDVLTSFANYFDVTVDELLGKEDDYDITNSDNAIEKNFSHIIKSLRLENDLTKFEVAEHMGLTSEDVLKYENGSSQIPLSILIKFSSYYNVGIDQLLGADVSKEDSKAVFVSNNEKYTKRYKYWHERFGNIQFSDEEFESICDYVEFLMLKRKK